MSNPERGTVEGIQRFKEGLGGMPMHLHVRGGWVRFEDFEAALKQAETERDQWKRAANGDRNGVIAHQQHLAEVVSLVAERKAIEAALGVTPEQREEILYGRDKAEQVGGEEAVRPEVEGGAVQIDYSVEGTTWSAESEQLPGMFVDAKSFTAAKLLATQVVRDELSESVSILHRQPGEGQPIPAGDATQLAPDRDDASNEPESCVEPQDGLAELLEWVEEAAAGAQGEARRTVHDDRRLYCEGQESGLRAVAGRIRSLQSSDQKGR